MRVQRFYCCRSTWLWPSSRRNRSSACKPAAGAAGAGGSPPATNRHGGAAPNTGADRCRTCSSSRSAPQQPFHVELPHSRKPFSPYIASDAPPLDLTNSPRLQNLISDGKLYISLHDAIALAIENNLDLAYFRYNFPIAQTDYARTKAGGSRKRRQYRNRAVIHPGWLRRREWRRRRAPVRDRLRPARAASCTSTLGAGTQVASFDPFLNFKGFVDHNVTQEANQSQAGVPLFKQNTIEGLVFFTQSFPLGTNVTDQLRGPAPRQQQPVLCHQSRALFEFPVANYAAVARRFRDVDQRALHAHREEESPDHRSCLSRASHCHGHAGREYLLGSCERLPGRADQGALCSPLRRRPFPMTRSSSS